MTALNTKLESLKDLLLAWINPFVGKYGVIIKRGEEQFIKTITDAIPNYFYLDYTDGDGQVEFNPLDDSACYQIMNAKGSFKLVARFTGYDINVACDALTACILDCGGELVSLSTDAAWIYSEEVPDDKDGIKCDLDLIRIVFTLEQPIKPKKNCIELLCKTEAC